MNKITKLTLAFSCLAAIFAACTPYTALSDWTRVPGYEGGGIDGKPSPVTTVVYEFTATVENTIGPLTLPTAGGCLTTIALDFLTPTPDSITTTLKNSLALAVTGPSTSALTADGLLYQTDSGSPICFGKGISFTFTGTISVGDKFRLLFDAMTD